MSTVLLNPLRQRLDAFEISDSHMAQMLCTLIPARCPFAREIKLFNRTLFSIPPLCKLNPFYEQLVGMRFRALTFLVEHDGKDVAMYC